MLVLAKRLALAAVIVVVGALVLIWLALFSSLLAEPRGAMAQRILADRLGGNLAIAGGVDFSLDSGLRFNALDLVLPANDESGANPLEITELSVAVGWRDLLRRQLHLSDVQVSGARIALSVDSDGAANWQGLDVADLPISKNAGESSGSGWQVSLSDKQISLSDAVISYQSAVSGLDLDLEMWSMELIQSDANWNLQGDGQLNKQPVKISGALSADQSFDLSAAFDELNLKIDGKPAAGDLRSGFSANVTADISKLSQLLDILKLQKPISGTGTASAVFTASGGKRSIDDLKLQVDLDSGESLNLTGKFGEIRDLNQATLKMDISLYPPDEMPAPAKLRRDLKLTGLEVVLTAQPEGYPLRQLTARTNGFTVNTHGRGPPPITVSDIRITSDGLLDLGKVGLRIGPPDAYFLVFEGSIGDALRVKDIDLDATLDLPIIALLKPDDAKDGDALGKITGSFHLSGDSKTLALSDLSAKAQATDLMQMNVTASAGNVLKLSDLSMDISANIPSGAKLLSALKHSSVATGAIDFAAKLSSDGQKWQSETKVSVGKSNLEMALNAQTGQPDPQLDGQITSTLISLTDVRHIISARRELGRTHRDRGKSDGLVSNVTLERLSAEILQSGMDIDIQIDLKKLQGVAGTSSVKTEFIMKNQKAKIGPVKFEYDGGNFDVTGSVDVAKHPDIVTIKGTADGWNFGTILQELNFKKHGSGILNASLDVSGAHKSVEEFARTATGNILVTMRDGRIHTRLLDLAGLGILPWLFSDSHGKVAPIVCLRAPLKFADGKITIDEAALETKKVQMVANGDVDLRNETVDVTGEPRPIGKPLSRSPWPFVVSGPLKHPKLRLKRGPHRQKRSDGASTMPEHRKLCIPDILQLR